MSGAEALVLTLAVPLAGAVGIVLLHRRPNPREAVSLISAGGLFAAVASMLPEVLAGARPEVTLVSLLPGLPIRLAVEPLGLMFGLVSSGLWIVTSVYSIGYMRAGHAHKQTRYYTCFAVALASTMGVAFAGNMLTLFIFYEALTLSTYPLVAHHETREAVRAGRTYLGILLGTSIGLQLVAIVWTWQLAGTLDFTAGGILEGKVDGAFVPVLLALYMFGIGKAALMPVHRWLPAAMVAPTPVSALLHAVAVVKAGVFTVVKVIVYIFGAGFLAGLTGVDWLIYAAGATILIASVIALRSDNLKRRLAYSTVSQLSYVVMAAAIATPLSIIGAALHIAAHAFGKITLFFAAGAISTVSHKTEVSELAGIGRRMPWTMGAFAVGAISMIGVPPTVGFVSKWYILSGALKDGETFAVAVIVLSTLLNAAYLLPIVYDAFFNEPVEAAANPGDDAGHQHGEAPLTIVAALVVSAAGTVILFFLPDLPPLSLAEQLVGTTSRAGAP
ncbi:MAG: monovalent cation/H+ antiporter subunit D family protein [Kiloniellales bacterium]